MSGASASSLAADQGLLEALSPESAIVALTAAGGNGDAVVRRLIAGQVDWRSLMALAGRERAIGALFGSLSTAPKDAVPPELLTQLQRLAMVSTFQLASLHDRLAQLLGHYSRNGIDAMLLKGAGLAHTAYARPVDRPMGDIDLLVRPEQAEAAWQLAVSHGWRRRTDVPEERSYADHQHLTPLEDADGLQIGLELHTALFTHQAPFNLPATKLWAAARPVRVGGQDTFVPCPEDQLLHAALHFAWSHEMTWGAWRTLRDVDRIVKTSTLDWTAFVERIRAARGASCGYWTLRLARDLSGVNVPAHVLDALQPRLPAPAMRRLARHFARQALTTAATATNSVSVSRAVWTLGIRPKAHGHGASRPWLDTEEWVRGPDGMQNSRRSARRAMRDGFGVLRSLRSLIAP